MRYNAYMDNSTYVYVIFRPTGEPCYIGKGHGGRWRKHVKRSHNPHLKAIYAKANYDLPAIIIRENLSDDKAIETEVALIKAIGREEFGGPLVNLTDGGDGTVGAKMSDEWKAHRAEKAREMWVRPGYKDELMARLVGNSYSKKPHKLSAEWRAELTEKMLGNTYTLGLKHTEEAKNKMSVARKGVPKTCEHKAKIGAAHMGMKRSPETCENISKSLRGRTIPEVVRSKMSEALKGRPKSEATKLRMKEAWVIRKNEASFKAWTEE